MAFLKKHWGNILAIAGPIIVFLVPSMNVYATHHKDTLVGTIISALLVVYNSRAPKDQK